MPLAVKVNGAPGGDWAILELAGVLYAPEEAFAEWRVSRRQEAKSIMFRDQRWFSLDSVAGFAHRLDPVNQSLDVTFAPSAFSATALTDEAERPLPLSPAEPALFLNLDMNLTQSRSSASGTARDLGFISEWGYASNFGVLTTSFVARNLLSNDPARDRTVRRLESTWTRDFLEQRMTLKLGDSTTRAGMTGRSTAFTGLQLGRNFALSPGLSIQATPTIFGSTVAPSTVELYVNDILRQTSNVPTGPFAIDNASLFSGAGTAKVVVRDALGRETVVSQPFFTHASLMDPDLTDWSVEVGAVRRNIGTDNANWGDRFASGIYRRGMNDSLTLEFRGDLGSANKVLGFGGYVGLPFQALGQAAVAFSKTPSEGSGTEWRLGLEQSSTRHWLTLSLNRSSLGYRTLGTEAGNLPNRQEATAAFSYSGGLKGVWGLSLAQVQTFDRGTFNTLSLNYSIRAGKRGSLGLFANRATGASQGTSIGATLTLPLDNGVNTAGNFQHRSGRSEFYASATQQSQQEGGWNWRTLAGHRTGTLHSEAGVSRLNEQYSLTAEISASSDQQTLRLGGTTGLVYTGGRFFTTRNVTDSFALVEVPGYPNVGVGFQGDSITRTDSKGQALLSRLMAYQGNSIRLNASDLPISAEIDSIEQIAVPPWRSGVKILFPVRSGRGALLKIVLEDGEPAPAGAVVVIDGDNKEFFVARRGEAFVTGLQEQARLRLQWNGGTCVFALILPPGTPDDIARVGPITCAGVKR